MTTYHETIKDGVGFRDEVKPWLKIQFAYMHLMAARDAAIQAYKVNHAELITDGVALNVLLKTVPVAVLMAAAALEANANEMIQNKLDEQPWRLTDCARKLLEELRDDRSGNSIDRYRKFALFLEKHPNTGTSVWEDARLLVQFRNFLMHIRPSFDDDDKIHHSTLAAQMRNKVPILDIYRENFVFPRGVMTYGCAAWAVTTVLNFASEYSSFVSLENAFVSHRYDFAMPDGQATA